MNPQDAIMVIFGAGASYDSVPSRPPWHYRRESLFDRPPLAKELFIAEGHFANCLRQFPQCNPIVPYLQSVPSETTLEHVLEGLQAEAETDPRRKRQLAAVRFYLQHMILETERRWNDVANGITNYVTLLDQLRRCRSEGGVILLVTFNYDTMIEQALHSVDIQFAELEDYTKYQFKLFKLHGSADWGREIENTPDILQAYENLIPTMIDMAAELKISDRFRRIVNADDRRHSKSSSIPVFPAIAIPVETKRSFECPSFHLECLRKHTANVTKILTIGWRATEQHFLNELSAGLNRRVHLQAVAGKDNKAEAEQILQRIIAAGISSVGVGEATDDGFTEYVLRREAEQFFGT
jgi:hypothetical protein